MALGGKQGGSADRTTAWRGFRLRGTTEKGATLPGGFWPVADCPLTAGFDQNRTLGEQQYPSSGENQGMRSRASSTNALNAAEGFFRPG